MKYLIALILVILGLSNFPIKPILTQGQETYPSFEEVECRQDFPFLRRTKGVQCGYLTVLENHDDPDSLPIDLAVVILKSKSANPLPDPIIYLEGGPGGSAIYGVDYWIDDPLRDNRDI